jgi:excisionase family DNA binding protein
MSKIVDIAPARSYNPNVQSVAYAASGLDRCSEGDTVDTDAREYQDVIDQALQLVYSHHHRLIHQLYPSAFTPLTLEQLRSGTLGQDLTRLALLARGQIRESKEHVLTAIESIVQMVFLPAAADDYSVPRSVWVTDLGRMLALAKFKAFEPNELVSIGNAAQQLSVTRPTIYRWMDDRTLNYVRYDMSGRTFVVRRDIENLKNVAREFEAQQ